MYEDMKVFEKEVSGLGKVILYIDEARNGAWIEVRKSNGEWGWTYARNCNNKLEFGHVIPPLDYF